LAAEFSWVSTTLPELICLTRGTSMHQPTRCVVRAPADDHAGTDDAAWHRPRYTWAILRQELEAAGFEPRIHTHVFSWLVVPVWLTRRVASTRRPELGLERTSPTIDRLAMALTFLERSLVGRVSIPFGTSILCVAEPRATHQMADGPS
jgi:hypothetical protein